MIRLGVTGTDTGVGKTVVTAALAAAMHRRGLRVAAMKPVETGVCFDDAQRDGAKIARAAARPWSLRMLAPITLDEPLAPLIAARHMGRCIDLATLDQAMRDATADADALLVEGAGGLLVPITDQLSYDALFARWSLSVIIVAVNRLGVINHTRLTVAAARDAGLAVRAIVLKATATPGDRSTQDNAPLIAELTGAPVVSLPWLSDADDLDAAAAAIEHAGLVELAIAS